MKKLLFNLLLLVTLFLIVACGNNGDELEEAIGENEAEEVSQQAVEEPTLEEIPEVVAKVNEKEISREEFETIYTAQLQQMALQSQMTGQEVDEEALKGQVVESLIGQELLIQEANNAGFEATEDEVDELIDDLVTQNGFDSSEQLYSALEDEGTDRTEFLTQAETQVKLDKLIQSISNDVEPTETELEELYEQLIAQQQQMGGDEMELPSYEEVRDDLIEEIKYQEETQVIQTLIQELRDDAEITNFL